MRPTALVEAEPPPPFESGYTQGRFLRQDSNRYAQQRSRDPHEAYARGVGSLRIDHVGALILERYPEQWNLVVHGHDSSVPAIIRLKGPVPDGVEAWLAGLLGDDIVIQGGERFSRTELSLRVRIFHCGLVKQGFVAQTGLNNEGIHAQVQSTEPLGDEVLEAVRAYSLTDLGDIPRGGGSSSSRLSTTRLGPSSWRPLRHDLRADARTPRTRSAARLDPRRRDRAHLRWPVRGERLSAGGPHRGLLREARPSGSGACRGTRSHSMVGDAGPQTQRSPTRGRCAGLAGERRFRGAPYLCRFGPSRTRARFLAPSGHRDPGTSDRGAAHAAHSAVPLRPCPRFGGTRSDRADRSRGGTRGRFRARPA